MKRARTRAELLENATAACVAFATENVVAAPGMTLEQFEEEKVRVMKMMVLAATLALAAFGNSRATGKKHAAAAIAELDAQNYLPP